MGPIGCRVLAGSALLSRLTELNLNNNKLKDVGVKALANADLLAIEDLSLSTYIVFKMTIQSQMRDWLHWVEANYQVSSA